MGSNGMFLSVVAPVATERCTIQMFRLIGGAGIFPRDPFFELGNATVAHDLTGLLGLWTMGAVQRKGVSKVQGFGCIVFGALFLCASMFSS